VTVPRPPARCPWCGAFDPWEETPTMYRRALLGEPEYEDWWRCGVCGREYRVPMPVDPTTMARRARE